MMKLNNAVLAVALSVSLAPVAARADDGWTTTPRTDWTQGWSTSPGHRAEASDRRDFWEGYDRRDDDDDNDRGYGEYDRDHHHDGNCHVQHRGGRYELQNVQRW